MKKKLKYDDLDIYKKMKFISKKTIFIQKIL